MIVHIFTGIKSLNENYMKIARGDTAVVLFPSDANALRTDFALPEDLTILCVNETEDFTKKFLKTVSSENSVTVTYY